MRNRETIEKDLPTDLPRYDDNYEMEGFRNTQKLLAVIAEVLLDIREQLLLKGKIMPKHPMNKKDGSGKGQQGGKNSNTKPCPDKGPGFGKGGGRGQGKNRKS